MTTTPTNRRLTLADLSAADRERIAVCFHEAGHAVASVALGGAVTMAVVGPNGSGGAMGEVQHNHVPVGAMSAITYAGPWAQARWLAGRRPTQRDLYAVLDGHGCRDYAALQASGDTAEASRIVPLLERCWPAITTLAVKTLYHPRKACLARNADVLAALGITDGGGPGSHQLAMIRSGRAPGSFRVTPARSG